MPRTLYGAVYNESGTLEKGLKSISPLHLIDKMLEISYHIFHCKDDKAINIGEHSEKLISMFEENGFNYTYDVVDGRDHCDLTL